MTTPTEDELLALARKALAEDDYLTMLSFRSTASPAAIIALIERHRAEVAALTRERDEAQTARQNAVADLAAERISSEFALAAERKRVGELEKQLGFMVDAIDKKAARVQSWIIEVDQNIGPHYWHEEWLYHARAALAGKTEHRDMGPDFTHTETNCGCGGGKTEDGNG